MKIDTTGIEGYAEMTAEQKVAALEGYEYEDTATLEATLKKTKESLNKASSEAADYKRKYNSTLDDGTKAAEETAARIKELEDRLAEADKNNLVSRLKAEYIGQNYSAELAEAKAIAVAENDFDKMLEVEKKYAEEREKAIRADIAKSNPRPGGGNGADVNADEAVERAKKLGASRNASNKSANDILKQYFKN